MSAFARNLVDESDALGLELGQLRVDVVDAIGGVVQLGRGLATVLRDRRILGERTQEFDDRVARPQSDGFDALVGHDLAIDLFETERTEIEIEGRVEIFDDDGHVVDVHPITSLAR